MSICGMWLHHYGFDQKKGIKDTCNNWETSNPSVMHHSHKGPVWNNWVWCHVWLLCLVKWIWQNVQSLPKQKLARYFKYLSSLSLAKYSVGRKTKYWQCVVLMMSKIAMMRSRRQQLDCVCNSHIIYYTFGASHYVKSDADSNKARKCTGV